MFGVVNIPDIILNSANEFFRNDVKCELKNSAEDFQFEMRGSVGTYVTPAQLNLVIGFIQRSFRLSTAIFHDKIGLKVCLFL
jgi:hypothetical protein